MSNTAESPIANILAIFIESFKRLVKRLQRTVNTKYVISTSLSVDIAAPYGNNTVLIEDASTLTGTREINLANELTTELLIIVKKGESSRSYTINIPNHASVTVSSGNGLFSVHIVPFDRDTSGVDIDYIVYTEMLYNYREVKRS